MLLIAPTIPDTPPVVRTEPLESEESQTVHLCTHVDMEAQRQPLPIHGPCKKGHFTDKMGLCICWKQKDSIRNLQ